MSLSEHTSQKFIDGQIGPYSVYIAGHELQTDRQDPLAPTPEKRRIRFSTYIPRAKPDEQGEVVLKPYVSPVLEKVFDKGLKILGVPNATVQGLQIKASPESIVEHVESKLPPLLLFSPGATGSQYQYQTVLQSIASSGFAVVALDHAHDSSVIEYADGKVAYNNYKAKEGQAGYGHYCRTEVVPARADDASCILDSLQAGQVKGFEAYRCEDSSKSLKVIFLGHSLGGATAWYTASQEDRIAGVINWDGGLRGIEDRTVGVPVLFIASQNQVETRKPPLLDEWKDAIPSAKAFRQYLVINGAGHLSFTDLPVTADTLNFRETLTDFATGLLGSISGDRVLHVLQDYTRSMVRYALEGEKEALLDESSQKYPEVRYLLSDGLIVE